MSSIAFLPLNKIKKNDLKKGDHIYIYKNLHFYSHHGIYVGDNRVIHFNKAHDKSILQEEVCEDCGHDKRSYKGVIKTCVECFSDGHGLYLFKYGVSSSRFFFDAIGACSTNECDDPITVVERAESMLAGDNGGFGEFSILENNCECFALHCKIGNRLSPQIVKWKAFSDVAFRELRLRNIINPFRAVKSVGKILVVPKMEALQRDKMARHPTYSGL